MAPRVTGRSLSPIVLEIAGSLAVLARVCPGVAFPHRELPGSPRRRLGGGMDMIASQRAYPSAI